MDLMLVLGGAGGRGVYSEKIVVQIKFNNNFKDKRKKGDLHKCSQKSKNGLKKVNKQTKNKIHTTPQIMIKKNLRGGEDHDVGQWRI